MMSRCWPPVEYVAPKRRSQSLSRLVVLCFIALSLQQNAYHHSDQHTRLVIMILGPVCAAGWIVWSAGTWLVPDWALPRAVVASVLCFGLVGSVLTAYAPNSAALAFPAAAALVSTIRLRNWRYALAAVAVFSATTLAFGLARGDPLSGGLGFSGVYFGMFGLGLSRRSSLQRMKTTAQLLAETERANAESAHAAALAERSRIAREIHDVLAHSLAALSVQLEAADALLVLGGAEERAHGHVVTARRIAREGLTETRRAIAALREDTPPLRSLLTRLAESYEADSGAHARVVVDREPEGLSADVALALYRTAQESLTNTRKHAPGADVELALAQQDARVELTVANGAPTGAVSPLASSGGGYGLTGLKERAELAGGTFEAGPCGQGWRVRLTFAGRDDRTLGG